MFCGILSQLSCFCEHDKADTVQAGEFRDHLLSPQHIPSSTAKTNDFKYQ